MAQLEIKKMKQGMSYSCKEKTIILNVFKYFRLLFPDQCVTEIVRRTAKATGCSEKSIFQFRKEESSAEGFKIPSTTKIRKNININSRDIKYDQTVRQGIRNIIYDLKYKNIVPSLNTILRHINDEPNLPRFSLMTLRRLLFDMGFCYEKNGNKSVLVEKFIDKKENLPRLTNKKNQPKTRSQNTQEIQGANSSNNTQQMPQNVPHHQNIVNRPQQRLYMQHENNQLTGSHVSHHYNMPLYHHHHASNMNMHLKHEMPPPWMHHPPPHALMKQE